MRIFWKGNFSLLVRVALTFQSLVGLIWQVILITKLYLSYDVVTKTEIKIPYNVHPVSIIYCPFLPWIMDMKKLNEIMMKRGPGVVFPADSSKLELEDLIPFLTAQDFFDLTPSGEDIKIVKCRYRIPKSYLTNHGECGLFFNITRYLRSQYMCYRIKINMEIFDIEPEGMGNEKRWYSFHQVKNTISHPGLLYEVDFDGTRFESASFFALSLYNNIYRPVGDSDFPVLVSTEKNNDTRVRAKLTMMEDEDEDDDEDEDEDDEPKWEVVSGTVKGWKGMNFQSSDPLGGKLDRKLGRETNGKLEREFDREEKEMSGSTGSQKEGFNEGSRSNGLEKFDRIHDNHQREKRQGQEEGQQSEKEESLNGLEGSRKKKVISYRRKDDYSVAFQTIRNILLPSPYSSHCYDWTRYEMEGTNITIESQADAISRCIWNETISNLSRIPLTTNTWESNRPTKLVSLEDLKNVTFFNAYKRIEEDCKNRFKSVDCDNREFVTKLLQRNSKFSDPSNNGQVIDRIIAFRVYIPDGPSMVTECSEKLALTQFLVYLFNCVSTWFGISLFGLHSVLLSPLLMRRNRSAGRNHSVLVGNGAKEKTWSENKERRN